MADTGRTMTRRLPLEKLPDVLRQGFEGVQYVRVTVEADDLQVAEPRPLHEMAGFAAELYASHGLAPVEFIRQLRDEWDD